MGKLSEDMEIFRILSMAVIEIRRSQTKEIVFPRSVDLYRKILLLTNDNKSLNVESPLVKDNKSATLETLMSQTHKMIAESLVWMR